MQQPTTIGRALDGLWATTLEQQQRINAARALLGIEQPVTATITARATNGTTAPQPKRARRRRRAGPMTKWIASARAKRPPDFVVQSTGGLKTKAEILARYGEGAVFQVGKPLPPVVTVPKTVLRGAERKPAAPGRAPAAHAAATA